MVNLIDAGLSFNFFLKIVKKKEEKNLLAGLAQGGACQEQMVGQNINPSKIHNGERQRNLFSLVQ